MGLGYRNLCVGSDPGRLAINRLIKPNSRHTIAMEIMLQRRNKAIVLKGFDTLFNRRDFAAAKCFWSPDYIQHSALVPAGRDGLFDLVRRLPLTHKYEPGLTVAENDFVVVHGRYSGLSDREDIVAVDIIRITGDVMVEHWDVLQYEVTRQQSKGGNPMFGTNFSERSRVEADRPAVTHPRSGSKYHWPAG
jgi:predicted SnoaL-like aldol condensation-catalyzing enzyme